MCSKVVGLSLYILLTIPHSKVDTIRRIYVFKGILRQEDALLITITQIKKSLILIQFLLMLHYRFVDWHNNIQHVGLKENSRLSYKELMCCWGIE